MPYLDLMAIPDDDDDDGARCIQPTVILLNGANLSVETASIRTLFFLDKLLSYVMSNLCNFIPLMNHSFDETVLNDLIPSTLIVQPRALWLKSLHSIILSLIAFSSTPSSIQDIKIASSTLLSTLKFFIAIHDQTICYSKTAQTHHLTQVYFETQTVAVLISTHSISFLKCSTALKNALSQDSLIPLFSLNNPHLENTDWDLGNVPESYYNLLERKDSVLTVTDRSVRIKLLKRLCDIIENETGGTNSKGNNRQPSSAVMDPLGLLTLSTLRCLVSTRPFSGLTVHHQLLKFGKVTEHGKEGPSSLTLSIETASVKAPLLPEQLRRLSLGLKGIVNHIETYGRGGEGLCISLTFVPYATYLKVTEPISQAIEEFDRDSRQTTAVVDGLRSPSSRSQSSRSQIETDLRAFIQQMNHLLFLSVVGYQTLNENREMDRLKALTTKQTGVLASNGTPPRALLPADAKSLDLVEIQDGRTPLIKLPGKKKRANLGCPPGARLKPQKKMRSDADYDHSDLHSHIASIPLRENSRNGSTTSLTTASLTPTSLPTVLSEAVVRVNDRQIIFIGKFHSIRTTATGGGSSFWPKPITFDAFLMTCGLAGLFLTQKFNLESVRKQIKLIADIYVLSGLVYEEYNEWISLTIQQKTKTMVKSAGIERLSRESLHEKLFSVLNETKCRTLQWYIDLRRALIYFPHSLDSPDCTEWLITRDTWPPGFGTAVYLEKFGSESNGGDALNDEKSSRYLYVMSLPTVCTATLSEEIERLSTCQDLTTASMTPFSRAASEMTALVPLDTTSSYDGSASSASLLSLPVVYLLKETLGRLVRNAEYNVIHSSVVALNLITNVLSQASKKVHVHLVAVLPLGLVEQTAEAGDNLIRSADLSGLIEAIRNDLRILNELERVHNSGDDENGGSFTYDVVSGEWAEDSYLVGAPIDTGIYRVAVDMDTVAASGACIRALNPNLILLRDDSENER